MHYTHITYVQFSAEVHPVGIILEDRGLRINIDGMRNIHISLNVDVYKMFVPYCYNYFGLVQKLPTAKWPNQYFTSSTVIR